MPRNRPTSTTPARCSSWVEQGVGVRDGAEGGVQDEVALVGDGTAGRRRPVRSVTIAPSCSRKSRSGRRAIVITSTGIANVMPSAATSFGLVDDDHQLVARLRDDLLAQVRTAAALDQVEVGRHLVGAVDRDVEARVVVERGQGDAEVAGLRRAGLRGRRRRRCPRGCRRPAARRRGGSPRSRCSPYRGRRRCRCVRTGRLRPSRPHAWPAVRASRSVTASSPARAGSWLWRALPRPVA